LIGEAVQKVLHHPSRILLACLLLACSARKTSPGPNQLQVVPEPWVKLVPADGLELVRKETNEHAFLADYRGCTAEQLLARVDRTFVGAGYKRTCTQFEGVVRGYTKGLENLLVKVDTFGSVQALLVGNERGPEPLLYGVCFKGYQLQPAKRVK
jgi:hypothetical protein